MIAKISSREPHTLSIIYKDCYQLVIIHPKIQHSMTINVTCDDKKSIVLYEFKPSLNVKVGTVLLAIIITIVSIMYYAN